MRKSLCHIWLAILLAIFITGCATTPKWNTLLWQTDEALNTDKPEIGRLQTDTARYDFIVTEFSKMEVVRSNKKPSLQRPSFIGVSISCKNRTDETIVLENSPIQVIDAYKILVKQLHPDHVVYKLYGGRLKERADEARLAELSQPLPSSETPILDAVVQVLRAKKKASIINEMYRKEADSYELYYQSFIPTSLPPNISSVWTEYYPYTTQTITIILQRQNLEDGIPFGPPSPKPIDSVERQKPSSVDIILAISAGIIFCIVMLSIT